MTVIASQPTYSTGKLAYHNLLEDSAGTVTVSTEAAGFLKENAYNWKSFNWWKPTATGDSWLAVTFATAQTADYFAVAAHDVSTQGGSVKLQYSTNGSTWSDATTAAAGTSDRVIFKTFDAISARWWRVLVNAPTTVISIGIVSFGDRLDLVRGFPSGFIPPALGRVNSYNTSVSNDGQFLGRSIERKTYQTSFNLPNLEPGWVRNYWEAFADHAEIKPFFFSWDTSSHADEVVFAWLSGGYSPPNYDTETTMSVQMQISCKR